MSQQQIQKFKYLQPAFLLDKFKALFKFQAFSTSNMNALKKYK